MGPISSDSKYTQNRDRPGGQAFIGPDVGESLEHDVYSAKITQVGKGILYLAFFQNANVDSILPDHLTPALEGLKIIQPVE